MKNRKELPLRIGVGIALLNRENKIFVGKRIDNPANSWQMPQGGVDKNEDFLQAAKRELEEETSIRTVEVIKQLNEWMTYDLPKNLLGKLWKGKYRGQKQKWFIMQFLGKNDEINIRTKKAEFLDWKWIILSDLPKVAIDFKANIYKKIAKEIASVKLN